MALLLSTCENKEKGGKNSIDEKYIASKSYQSFKKKSHLEREHLVKQKEQFARFVQKKLSQNGGKNLKLPAVIDEQLITASLQSDSVDHTSIINALGFQQIYYSLAMIPVDEIEYRFFMTCKVASFKDCLIWFASMKTTDLIQIQMIAIYKNTLTYSEIPAIKITSSNLDIEINKTVKYQFANLDSYTLRYNFTDNGEIYWVQRN